MHSKSVCQSVIKLTYLTDEFSKSLNGCGINICYKPLAKVRCFSATDNLRPDKNEIVHIKANLIFLLFQFRDTYKKQNTSMGEVEIDAPRDRDSFEPGIIP